MTENSFAEQITKNAQIGAQAEAPFGAAIGVSKAVAETAFKSETAAETVNLNFEVTKKKLEQAGAGAVVIELVGKCFDGVGKNLEKFGKWHKGRAEGRLEQSTKQRTTIENIKNEKVAKLQRQEEQRILQAQVEQFNPNYRVVKAESWWQNEVGNKLDSATTWFKENVIKKYNEMRVVANESDAKKFSNRAEVFDGGAKLAKKFAQEIRTMVGNTKQQQENRAEAEFVQTRSEKSRVGDRATTASEALQRTREADYFMPDAKSTSNTIKAEGGDADFSHTADAAKEWSGRAAGTNTTA
jgi:hypothetical protein